MPDQIPGNIKSDRRKALAAVESECRKKYFQTLIGEPLEVLAEGSLKDKPGILEGTTCRFASIQFEAASDQIGQLIQVMPTAIEDEKLVGHVI